MFLLLRRVLFWVHLTAGALAGLVIATLCVTGAALAFKPQLLDWAERDLRTAAPSAPGAAQLSLEEVLARARSARPDARPTAVTLSAEPGTTAQVALGRAAPVYVDRTTGAVRGGEAGGLRAAFHGLEDVHRWLAAEGERRPFGKAATGASNAAFLFLALSGLYLWWPRRWGWRAVRPTLWFRRGVRGKARDFNWHNVIGFWSLPVLVVLTASGLVISYKWASDLVFTVSGSPVPPPGPPPGAGVKLAPPADGARPLPLDVAVARAQAAVPDWRQLTVRLQGAGTSQRREGTSPAAEPGGGPARARGPEAVTVAIQERAPWPRFATVQLAVDPFTGEVLKREGFADANTGRKARSWLRFLHTGEALGWPGQLVAGLASLGGALLVWTGLALALRRFAAWRRARALQGEPRPASNPAEPSV